MSVWQVFMQNLDLDGLLTFGVRIAAALLCIILHECAHGFAADCMGDHTARRWGRLSWNPLRHIDPLGLLMMVIAGVGWAKPVPVNPHNFKHPKRGMALTALAGPVSNFLLATVVLFVAGVLYRNPVSYGTTLWTAYYYLLVFLLRVVVMSLGLGLFNLIPIPPLDGSKILFSLTPDRVYFTILRYERFVMLALLALVFFGFLTTPLSRAINCVLYFLCLVTGFPPAALGF